MPRPNFQGAPTFVVLETASKRPCLWLLFKVVGSSQSLSPPSISRLSIADLNVPSNQATGRIARTVEGLALPFRESLHYPDHAPVIGAHANW
jgi:hypothetical protein